MTEQLGRSKISTVCFVESASRRQSRRDTPEFQDKPNVVRGCGLPILDEPERQREFAHGLVLASISAATVAGGVPITARSGVVGKSAGRAWQGSPSSVACLGLMA